MRLPWSRSAIVAHDENYIQNARIAFGGLSYKPWRSTEAEAAVSGATLTRRWYDTAGTAALKNARGHGHNDFKISLARRTLRATLAEATGTI
jgi:xanthine dehydrogenase YagS FAD-binding subunit